MWAQGSRSREVPCTVEIETSAESLEAHVELQGVEVGPGDCVLLHDAPLPDASGARVLCRRRATFKRAGRLQRVWTRCFAIFELGELFEVGFSSRRIR
jgi:hypothetical protein